METGMTNLGTGHEAGDVSPADKEAAEDDLQQSGATGGRPDGGQRIDDDDEVDPTGP